MRFNQNVSNPMLVGMIELLKAENSPEHREMLEDEMVKATYIAPVLISPEPEKNAAGEIVIKPGSQIQFPTLTASNGDKYFMAFTDKIEYEKSGKKEEFYEAALTFGDYVGMLFQKTPDNQPGFAAGFVINPFGGNIAMPKEAAMAIFMKKGAKR